MLLDRLFRPRPARAIGQALYQRVVDQSRTPALYADIGAPDTVEGRFEIYSLHVVLLLERLRGHGEQAAEVSQVLFDTYVKSLDHALREMGVGDLTVPKRMQAFGEAFYGRTAAYDTAFAAGEADLAIALNRNIFNDANIENARRLASYATATLGNIGQLGAKTFTAAQWAFPPFVGQE